MEEQEIDYYAVGSSEDIVISNSSLSSFDENLGGSPKKFLEFLNNKTEIKSKYFVTGSLLHLWAENKDAFHIALVPKPSEKLGIVADAVLQNAREVINDAKYLISTLTDAVEIERRTNQLNIHCQILLEQDSSELQQLVLRACRMIGWNNKYSDDAIIKNACPTIVPYVQDSLISEATNKQYLTVSDAELITGMVEGLKAKPSVWNSLFDASDDFENAVVYNEFTHYWTMNLILEDEVVQLKCKMKADKVIINHDRKLVIIKDLKTTGGSPYSFIKSFVKFDYARQFCFYNQGIKDYITYVLKVENPKEWKFQFENVVCEKGGLFETARVVIQNSVINAYNVELKELLLTLAWHKKNNIWNMSKSESINGGYLTIGIADVEKYKNSNKN